MDTRKCFAIVNDDNSGPAFGIGHSRGSARADAIFWGLTDHQTTKAIEITPASYDAVQAGHSDAWEAVTLTERHNMPAVAMSAWLSGGKYVHVTA